MSRTLTVASIQFTPSDDMQANIDRVAGFIREAAGQGADVVLPPELFCGYYFCKTQEEHHFEELVVVDRAGRLHIPKEFLEQFSIQGRAQLEVTEQGILIRATESDRVEVEVTKQHETQNNANSGLLGRFGLRRAKTATPATVEEEGAE